MRRILAGILLLMLVAGCSSTPKPSPTPTPSPTAPAQPAGLATFTNPVYAGTADKLPEAPDPAAIKFNGDYYAYVTGDPCKVLKSPDMVHWTLAGDMLTEKVNCWAPDVVYENGTFYAYAATVPQGGGEGDRRVRLYTSATPTGPFALQETVTERYSYDPGYFRDEDGKEYLYWTEICGAVNVTCSANAVFVDGLKDKAHLAGKPSLVADAEGWECKTRCIFEAPAVTKHNGLYFLQYSGAAYENDTYGGGYVRSKTPLGTLDYNKPTWTRVSQVLKTVENKVSGPGGAAWIKAPNNLDDWTIYHGRGFTKDTLDRWLRIDPVMWGRDQFWLQDAPSYGARLAPAQPSFADRFDRPDATDLGKAWTVSGGKWAVAGGQAKQADAAGTARAIAGEASMFNVLEANVRLEKGATGKAGAYAYYADENNWARAMLDPAAKALTVDGKVGGQPWGPKAFPLAKDFKFAVWHQLLITADGDEFTIALDGRTLSMEVFKFTAPGKAGLATEGAAADFDGVAIAQGWDDFLDGRPGLWAAAEDGTAHAGTWQSQGSYLEQINAGVRASAFKGSRSWKSYSFTVSLQPGGAKPAGGKFGVYGAYFDAQNYFEVLIDPAAGKLETGGKLNGKDLDRMGVDLPALKDWSTYHTLQVVKNGTTFIITVDGAERQSRPVRLPTGQPGLLTVNSTARFDTIHVARWE